MKLKTKRLIIRDLSLKDEEDYFEYASNPNVGPNAGWKPIENMVIARRVLSGLILSNETFGIVLKDEKKLIGTISLYSTSTRKWKYARSVGFSLNYNYWNKGYTTEALRAFIDYIFNKTDCQIIEIGHHVGNEASRKVILNCGFKYDGTFPKYKKLYDGRVIDAVMYSLEKIDYERMIENE